MKKLVHLKNWLTISEAARHLSILFGENVSEADVLRLALDRELKLSVYFLHSANARCGPLVPRADAKRHAVQSENGEWLNYIDGSPVTKDLVLEYTPEIMSLDGVWDLPMLGLERLDIERRYQNLTGGPTVNLISLVGPIIHRDDHTYCELIDVRDPFTNDKSDSFLPAFDGLPEDSVLVVRTSALQELETRLSEPESRIERSLERRERTTLLVMIAALAERAKIDWKRPSSAAALIESKTIEMGARIAARTIENHLNNIPDALESRKEN